MFDQRLPDRIPHQTPQIRPCCIFIIQMTIILKTKTNATGEILGDLGADLVGNSGEIPGLVPDETDQKTMGQQFGQ